MNLKVKGQSFLIVFLLGFIKVEAIEKLRFFYRGKEMPDDLRLYQLALTTEAKNEEGMLVKIPVGILVHAVRKRAEGEPHTSKVVGCNCLIVR